MATVQDIKSAIVDREEEITQKWNTENIIERTLLEKAKGFISSDAALIVTGVRRCGKSLFAVMLGENSKYAYVNFEDERLGLEAAELNKVLEAVYSLKGEVELLILDEIQNITGWEKFVARIIPRQKVVITGSNARLLSKELATYLTGRHINVTLFPFSFQEYLSFNQIKVNPNLTRDIALVKNELNRYLSTGGFPLVAKLGNIFLMETYRDILERDIIQRYRIRQVKAFKDLAKYVVSNTSSEFSYNKLKSIFNIKSVHTVKNYVSYLENAYLIFVLERFSFKLKNQVLAPKKLYCIDTGLAGAVSFTFSENHGKVMENAVAIELQRRVASALGTELYYWKDHQQREVDFILKEEKKVTQLIQVCYDLSDPFTKEREVKSLVEASIELRCKNALVITSEFEGEEKHGNLVIKFIPLWRWLLE
ncbi:MAG: ATP-binding protein [Nanoarchaeota archaeon]